MTIPDTPLVGQPLSDAVAAVGKPSTGQTISTATVTKLNIDTAEVQDGNVLAVDTASNEIVPQVSGTYFIGVTIQWGSDSGWSTGDRAEINSVDVAGSAVETFRSPKIGTAGQTAQGFYVDEVSAGDGISASIYQNSGTGQVLQAPLGTTLLVAKIDG